MIPYRERWHRSEGGVYTRAPHMMGMGMGVGFSSPPPVWTPAAVPGCILYGGGYREDRAVRAASPTIPGAGWTGANWAGAGLGPYQHTAGATADLTQAILIAGNRYTAAFAVSGLTAGTVTHKQGTAAGAVRSADGSYSDELTAQATSALWTPSNDFDGAVLVQSIVNLSLSSYSPAYTTIPGSVLAQATDTAQPWVSSEIINGRQAIQFANGDSATFSGSKTPWKFLHDGSAFTHIVVWRSNTFPGQTILGKTLSSLSLGSTGYGLHYNNAASAFDLYIANGSGSAWAINDRFAGAPGAGVVFVMTLRNDGSGNTTCWKNSTNLTRTRYSGAPSYSSSDPNNALTVGIGADANLLDQAVYNRCLTDAEVTQIGQYMASQWGITW